MAISIKVSNRVTFKVQGTIKDEKGADQKFDFTLTCKRLNGDQIKDRLDNEQEATLKDFMVGVVEDWSGVKDENGTAVPYTPDNYAELCLIPGISTLAFRAYLGEVGAKEKN